MDLDDLISDLLAPQSPLVLPAGAQMMFPEGNAPGIYTIENTNQVVKVDSSVKLSEAEAMRFASSKTSIPVPAVHESVILAGKWYIYMDRMPGRPLSKIWDHLSALHRGSLVDQLKEIVKQLGSLHGGFFGALWNEPSVDVFFIHLPFENGLLDALHNARPEGLLDELDQGLVEQLLRLTDDTKVFSHGDLHPGNILVDEQTYRITSIVDWEGAGFSIRGREYFEAKTRARNPTWSTALDEIFDDDEKQHFQLFQRLNQALTRYTCI